MKQIFQEGGRMSVLGSVRLDGACPKEERDPKEQAIKDSHNPNFQLHAQGYRQSGTRGQASWSFVRTPSCLLSQGGVEC